ncbi:MULTISPECIES: PaaI family thioesterase [Pseudomonas]|uniref:PaaI family thioesterase n=1 Tax=Pseudomonas TaxID=286 RepID=UPI00224AB87D|nr:MULTISPECIES: PaaI family thioesterase [unclassified Pseudomonas]MCX2888503.1 PaaI family thioesterase [Pseudomonas sp. DCB_BI]MDH4551916.1 PaaI family thioesterase [Pseudomonas sp. BN607]
MKDNLFWQIVAGLVPRPNAARLLGWNFISHELATREVKVQFDASESLTNPLGKIQGGMLTAMLDDCLGPAVYATLDTHEIALTVKLATTFVRPASPGNIMGIARMYRRRGAYCYAKGELRDGNDKTLVTASACYKVVSLASTGYRAT